MLRRFVILSGTSTTRGARRQGPREAMELVLQLMKLRRPGVRIETAEGEPLSFFN
jgi:hypothetical protein